MKNLSFLFIALSIITACKHKRNDVKPVVSDSKLSTVIYKLANHTYTYRIFYNASNDIDSMLVGDTTIPGTGTQSATLSVRKFSYYNGYYHIDDDNYWSIPTEPHQIVGINDIGLITYIKGHDDYYSGSDSFLKLENIYSDKDQLVQTTNFSRARDPRTENITANVDSGTQYYKWNTDNNPDSLVYYSSPMTMVFSFDLSRTGQVADINNIIQFLSYGRSYLIGKNVPVSSYTSTQNKIFHYEYDGSGRISRLWFTDDFTSIPDTTSFTYLYK